MGLGLLDGKVALITGGARGQGRAHAVTCAREGADVIIVDITKPVAEVEYPLATAEDHTETVRQVEALGRRIVAVDADVRDQSAIDAAVSRGIDELGKIDILIANAGIWTHNPFWEITEQQWDEMVGINLTGVWKSAKAVAPHMIERGSGSIVITSSANGIEPGPNNAHYVAAKHGVLGLMKNIALELGPHGVRCNAISPGATRTPMTDFQAARDIFAGHEGGTEAELMEAGYRYGILRNTTWLDPQAIADTALYLNSHLAANVTGVTIPVESGHLLIAGVNDNPVRE
ncbi:mycofactocin-coupled SDR family oxidoreductase [Pseudonocardia sp. TRM90224]|uniref:mycofactocin-coupled SDR family oxidoreductase n=1 Tax=Pseudonocardia sp. TRM90224 TaxID=2812678 RepID=UPI001E656859|nr:mycofactocin-coupled SDR family oxidoreductase [Pseudonocardia sp. TRM90224]